MIDSYMYYRGIINFWKHLNVPLSLNGSRSSWNQTGGDGSPLKVDTLYYLKMSLGQHERDGQEYQRSTLQCA